MSQIACDNKGKQMNLYSCTVISTDDYPNYFVIPAHSVKQLISFLKKQYGHGILVRDIRLEKEACIK